MLHVKRYPQAMPCSLVKHYGGLRGQQVDSLLDYSWIEGRNCIRMDTFINVIAELISSCLIFEENLLLV